MWVFLSACTNKVIFLLHNYWSLCDFKRLVSLQERYIAPDITYVVVNDFLGEFDRSVNDLLYIFSVIKLIIMFFKVQLKTLEIFMIFMIKCLWRQSTSNIYDLNVEYFNQKIWIIATANTNVMKMQPQITELPFKYLNAFYFKNVTFSCDRNIL